MFRRVHAERFTQREHISPIIYALVCGNFNVTFSARIQNGKDAHLSCPIVIRKMFFNFSPSVDILLFKVAKNDHYCLNLFTCDDGNWIIILILFNEDKEVNV